MAPLICASGGETVEIFQRRPKDLKLWPRLTDNSVCEWPDTREPRPKRKRDKG